MSRNVENRINLKPTYISGTISFAYFSNSDRIQFGQGAFLDLRRRRLVHISVTERSTAGSTSVTSAVPGLDFTVVKPPGSVGADGTKASNTDGTVSRRPSVSRKFWRRIPSAVLPERNLRVTTSYQTPEFFTLHSRYGQPGYMYFWALYKHGVVWLLPAYRPVLPLPAIFSGAAEAPSAEPQSTYSTNFTPRRMQPFASSCIMSIILSADS